MRLLASFGCFPEVLGTRDRHDRLWEPCGSAPVDRKRDRSSSCQTRGFCRPSEPAACRLRQRHSRGLGEAGFPRLRARPALRSIGRVGKLRRMHCFRGTIMKAFNSAFGAALSAVAALAVTACGPSGEAPSVTATATDNDSSGAYRAPRTSWGDPDLQGKWPGTHMVGVPMQRDENSGRATCSTTRSSRRARRNSRSRKSRTTQTSSSRTRRARPAAPSAARSRRRRIGSSAASRSAKHR